MSLKPELFEGMRFDFTKGLNPKFSLSHSVFMGSAEIPSQSSDTIKVPTAHYEFGANFLDPKIQNEPHFSQGIFNFDYKFLNMSSLQVALPNPTLPLAFIGGITETWFPQGSATSYMDAVPSGGLSYRAGQAPTSQLPNIPSPGPIASLGGNPFA